MNRQRLIKKADVLFAGLEYFKMGDWDKKVVQQHIWHKLREIRDHNSINNGINENLAYYYENALIASERIEDYEMCQAIRDSANLYEIKLTI